MLDTVPEHGKLPALEENMYNDRVISSLDGPLPKPHPRYAENAARFGVAPDAYELIDTLLEIEEDYRNL